MTKQTHMWQKPMIISLDILIAMVHTKCCTAELLLKAHFVDVSDFHVPAKCMCAPPLAKFSNMVL